MCSRDCNGAVACRVDMAEIERVLDLMRDGHGRIIDIISPEIGEIAARGLYTLCVAGSAFISGGRGRLHNLNRELAVRCIDKSSFRRVAKGLQGVPSAL